MIQNSEVTRMQRTQIPVEELGASETDTNTVAH